MAPTPLSTLPAGDTVTRHDATPEPAAPAVPDQHGDPVRFGPRRLPRWMTVLASALGAAIVVTAVLLTVQTTTEDAQETAGPPVEAAAPVYGDSLTEGLPPTSAWPSGTWATGQAGPGDLPAPSLLPADALPPVEADRVLLTDVAATGATLVGVGTHVTESQLRTLAALAGDEADRAIRNLMRPEGTGLGVVAVPPAPGADGSTPDVLGRDTSAADLDEALADLRGTAVGQALDVVGQQRSDLRIVRADTAPNVVGDLDAVVDETLTGLTAETGLLSDALLVDGGENALFEVVGDRLSLTQRGEVWTVAAHAVVPGAQEEDVTVTLVDGTTLVEPGAADGDLVVRAFTRPLDGGTSLLVWNPGVARDLVVDRPVGADDAGADQVERYALTLDAGALTAVVLPSPVG
ncbi:MAG: hypothetical protein CMH83_21675 [Nocardioides sp.]|nr:hypothetical protein [Nocardioides sp.]